jgi:cytoskeletal protein RodZ
MKSQRIAIATLILLLVCGAGLGVFWIVVSSADDRSPELDVSSDETALTPPETPETASRRKSQEPETRKDPDSVATHDAKRPAREPESADASPTITRTVENRPTRETSRLERPRNGVSSFPGSAPAEQTMEEFRVTIRGQVVDGSGQGVANAQVHGQFTPTGFDRTAPDAARARLHALRSKSQVPPTPFNASE